MFRSASFSSDEGLASFAPRSEFDAHAKLSLKQLAVELLVTPGEADRIYEFGSVPLKVSVSVPRRPSWTVGLRHY